MQNELNFKTGLIDFSQKVGLDKDRVASIIITTEEYNETYDKNFLTRKENKKGQLPLLQYYEESGQWSLKAN